MYSLEVYGGGLYLGILSLIDIKTRKIPQWLLVFGMSATIITKIICRDIPVFLVFAGIATGLLFCLVSKITREKFGMGDSYAITIIGGFTGVWNLLYILSYAFLFSACYSVGVLIFRKFNRKIQIPFIPFLMTAYLLWAFYGG